jgi:hypothetical protein
MRNGCCSDCHASCQCRFLTGLTSWSAKLLDAANWTDPAQGFPFLSSANGIRRALRRRQTPDHAGATVRESVACGHIGAEPCRINRNWRPAAASQRAAIGRPSRGRPSPQADIVPHHRSLCSGNAEILPDDAAIEVRAVSKHQALQQNGRLRGSETLKRQSWAAACALPLCPINLQRLSTP